ncbi:unnamed protein product [Wickerhamomyces anomalus]
MEQDRLFRFQPFKLPNSTALRSIGVYTSGALYAIGFWAFIDAVIYSKTVNASDVHVTFVDWIPIICSTLGMLIVNSIEKIKLLNDALGGGSSFGGSSSTTWQARVILFLGFSLLAGGIAGSIVVLILKFLIKHYTFPTLGMGVSNVVANGSIMLSCIVLWIAQNIEDEYSYSLAL